MTADDDFNLIDEPWIKAMDREGRPLELGILDCFKRAHELRGLAGELPTQDVAILRLLLAIVYAVFAKFDVNGDRAELEDANQAIEHWKGLWRLGRFNADLVAKYLGHHKGRFGLFHPETPFFQVAGLHNKDGGVNDVTSMICDVPSRRERRFFSNRTGEEATSLSFAEAARWLVHLHAFDYAGKKASTVGGNPNGGGTGWCGKLGLVYAERSCLFETLLANFILWTPGTEPDSLGKPCWEKPPPAPAKADRKPDGYVDLLTWQSRRVRLFREGNRVTGHLSSYGDVFEKANTFAEQMSGWHPSADKTKPGESIPNLHRADRSAWRDLSSLLPAAEGRRNGHRAPGAVAWADQLRLGGGEKLRLRTVGLEFGTMQASVNELVSDGVTLHAAMLSELGAAWLPEIFDAIEKTDQCVGILGTLARRLTEASGGSDDKNLGGVARIARERAYFEIDEPFREWLANINPEADGDNRAAILNEWLERRLTGVLHSLAADMVGEAGARALAGIVKRDDKTGKNEIVNSAKAHDAFLAGIRKALRG